MPLLQFDASFSIDDGEAFAEAVTELYAERMATSRGHVAVVLREGVTATLGRAEGDRLLFLDAEIRRGRSFDRKRAFALAVIEEAHDRFGIPRNDCKVVFTEHPGEAMMGHERVGGEWDGD